LALKRHPTVTADFSIQIYWKGEVVSSALTL